MMLPSTGYFKSLNCPFYDSGLCERPYCHFRHVKKEVHSLVGEGIDNGVILQQLVSEAVKKVLQSAESSSPSPGDLQSGDYKDVTGQSTVKATYNPTPIAELKKSVIVDTDNNEENSEQKRRHIPVPYTPRKPPSLPITRNIDPNGDCKPFIYIPPTAQYSPGSRKTASLDPYMPEETIESKEKYVPGSETERQEYKPAETQKTNNLNYIPSDAKSVKKKILEYEPVKVSSKNISAVYQPTPRSMAPCFSSDEDEPEVKKQKLSGDLKDFDDLGAEFDMLSEILDEEKSKEESKKADIKEKENISESKSNKTSKIDKNSKQDQKKDKEKDHKSKDTNSKEKSRKSGNSHKTSHKDKHREIDVSKSKVSDKKTQSSSKHSEKSSKHSEKSSKSSEKSTKSSEKSSKSSDRSSSSKYKDKKKETEKSSHKSSSHHRDSKYKKSKHKEKSSEKDKDSLNSDIDSNDHEELIEEMSESDEESIALECKRIFEEYVPTSKSSQQPEEQPANEENYEYIPTKKRISHTGDRDIKVIPKAPIKVDFKVSAAQKMAERLVKVKEYHAAKMAQKIDTEKLQIIPTKPITGNPPHTNGKIRIAHVPYASSMLNAKKNINTIKPDVVTVPSTSTISQTVKRGEQRVAHMPSDKFIDRPGVLEPLASKIPANVRSTYLNMMIDECLKIYISPTDAYARAQHEELTTSKKCKAIPIYKNSAVLAVSRLRKEYQECKGIKKSSSDCSQLQKITDSEWSIKNKNLRSYENPSEYKDKLYGNIQKWILTEEQLQENGFPRPHPSGERGRAIIYAERKQTKPQGFFRTCCRCHKEYTVDKKNFPTVKEECIYHPNRKYRYRGEVKYQCCSQDGMSDGCCVASTHVYEFVDYENLRGYIKTMPPNTVKEDYGVYALDCEMCYTTHGLDLTRLTVINSSCQVVYETLVKPLYPIIDYNTKFSGITEEQMMNVKTTLLDVQAAILTMFNSKTILIGHSLESDFKALKLIHDTVIDTSVLYPHKMGAPYKRALRNLCSEYLKKIIQNSVDGHNSAEDATACMELITFKLREDLKTR